MGRNLGLGLKRGQRPKNWKENCKKFIEYYRKHHPDWTEEQCQQETTRYNRSTNWQCIEYYEENYPNLTQEERLEKWRERQQERRKHQQQFIEYYQYHFPDASEEECQKMLSDFAKRNNFQNIQYYRDRFPDASEEECQKMLRDVKEQYRLSRPDNSGEKNPAHHSKTTELQRKQRSPMCIEFYELKYPELTDDERQQMLKKHRDNITEKMHDKTRQVRCVEYWVARGYTEEEAKKIISEQQKTFTLEKCISKYGLEEGTRRFIERQNKWLKSLQDRLKSNVVNGHTQSMFANDIVSEIQKEFPDSEQEYIIDNYPYDFRYKNKLIEFNGDYWHMNPTDYEENDINKTTGLTAKQIWEKDADKLKTAKDNGFDLFVVWERDYRDNKPMIIKKCLDFLYE